ncbi:MFS transporter [Clostridium autoethanogenum]
MMENISTKNNEMLSVIMLSLVLALRQMAMTIVSPFISVYSKSLLYNTPLLAGLALGIFGLTQAIFQIPFGALSDKYGNKIMMLIGILQVDIGLVVAFLAKNIYVFIFARALQGSGAILGVGYSWVSSMVTKDKEIKALSILGAFVSCAAALSFALGPIIHNFLPVNKMFLICALLIFVNWLYILLFLEDSKNYTNKIKNSFKENFKILVKNKTFIILNKAAFCNNFMMMAVFYVLPIYLSNVTGINGMWRIFIPSIIIAIIFMKKAIMYIKKYGSNIILAAAFAVSSLSIFFYFQKTSYIFLLLGTIFFFCGYMCLTTILATNVNNIVKDDLRGTANGIFNSFQYIGSFAGSIAAGALWGFSQRITLILTIFIGLGGIFTIIFSKSNIKEEGKL